MKKLLRTMALSALVAAPAFYANAEITGTGTAEDPYVIATKDDLCKAYEKTITAAGKMVYFVQTADIDLAGVTVWMPVAGGNANYANAIEYDGRFHEIKNFSPASRPVGEAYYAQTLFGVFSGTLKNLAIVDVNVDVTLDGTGQGGGPVCAYAGHGEAASVAPVTTFDNVYVTGKYNGGKSGYNGGLCGTNATETVVKNCFVNLEISGTNNIAPLVGRQRLPLTAENVYTAGTVTCTGKAALVCSSDKSDIALNATNVVALATGTDIAPTNGIKVTGEITWPQGDADRANAIAAIKGWNGYKGGDEVAGLPGLNWNGTEAHPYLIASPEDLQEAYKKVAWSERVVYFKQTADIELYNKMKWHAINGGNGQYNTAFVYDGDNHVIAGFEPESQDVDAGSFTYYCTTLFGVLTGTVKNLGLVDCVIDPTISGTATGGGAFCAYAGHSAAAALAPVTTIENVYIHGTIKGKDTGYTGAFCGTTGTDVVIRNAYANVEISADNNVATICGRQRNTITLENVYTAGTVTSAGKAALVSCSDKTDKVLKATNVIAFNSGKDIAPTNSVKVEGTVEWATDATKDALIATVKTWEAFSNVNTFESLPALAWQKEPYIDENSSVSNIVVEGEGAVEYYNLQGVRVANPENGIFIRRQGNKASKVLVK